MRLEIKQRHISCNKMNLIEDCIRTWIHRLVHMVDAKKNDLGVKVSFVFFVRIGDSNISTKLAISFGSLGVILLGFAIFYCYKTKDRGLLTMTDVIQSQSCSLIDQNNDRRSSSSSMESYQQLYFSKVPFDQLENTDHRVIERWSSVADPSLTFYR